jgi:hypothetical protein
MNATLSVKRIVLYELPLKNDEVKGGGGERETCERTGTLACEVHA